MTETVEAGSEIRRTEHPARRGAAWLAADRMAVLVVGLIAGFAVGLSFHPPQLPAPAPLAPVAGSAPMADGVAAPAPGATPVAAAPVDARVVRHVAAADGRVRIGVFGDSFGIGVWDALYRDLPREQGYEVLRFGKEATGFTRYNALNLEERAREQLAKDPVDIAVISFGANDAIPFYTKEGGLQPLMSPGWQRIVGQRLDGFVRAIQATGAKVYWLGLPAMRDPVLDANIQAMNRLYAAHMQALGVPFLDTRSLSVDEKGQYTAHLPDAKGVMRLMRTPDGLHMIGIGYERITSGLIDRIRKDADEARRRAGKTAPATAAPGAGA